MEALTLLGALFLAFVNGANDNFKGVATLYGSGALPYRRALALATSTTALGGLLSLALAGALVRAFSAKGLVPDAALDPGFLAAVAASASLTVLLATLLGMPVSTTHALVGGLVGTGWAAAGSDLDLRMLGGSFALPLILGPVISTFVTLILLGAGSRTSRHLGVTSRTCVCLGNEWVPVAAGAGPALAAAPAGRLEAAGQLSVSVGEVAECQQRYQGAVLGVSVQGVVTGAHLASAGLVSFARGLNDTPKILGLLAGASLLPPTAGLVSITLVMALGGWLAVRRVAHTMAQGIAPMTPAQGLAGNLTTALLVTAASPLGLPLSTTHVSTGAIFGIGLDSGRVRWGAVNGILAAWVITLPVAAALGAAILRLLQPGS